MSDVTALLDATEPISIGVPDHRASSGQNGDPAPKLDSGASGGKSRPGIFGRGTGTTPKMKAAPRAEKATTPKLGPHMRQKITDFYILLGGLAQPFDPLLGDTLIQQAPKCGKAVYDYAQENEAFRRVIQGFLTTSMGGALVFAHLPIVLILVSRSKNDRARMTAAGMMVAMSMMDQDTADEVFADKEEESVVA